MPKGNLLQKYNFTLIYFKGHIDEKLLKALRFVVKERLFYKKLVFNLKSQSIKNYYLVLTIVRVSRLLPNFLSQLQGNTFLN